MKRVLNIQEKFEMLGKGLAVALAFSIPLSTAATNVLLLLLMMAWFFSGNLRIKAKVMLGHPVARNALLLFGMTLLGILYTKAPIEEISSTLRKMSKLLYLPFLLPLMLQPQWRHKVLISFSAAVLLTLIFSYGTVYGGVHWASRFSMASVFKDHIYTGLLLAFFSFLVGHWFLNASGKLKIALAVLFLGLVFNLFFMNHGRTGYMIFSVLSLLFGFQRFGLKGFLWAVVFLIGLMALVSTNSYRFKERLASAKEDIVKYQRQDTHSSLGERMEYAKTSWLLVKQAPWLGSGTGSFKQRYAAIAKQLHIPSSNNPHNEYLNIAVQWGLMGLTLFLFFFINLWRLSFRLPRTEAWYAQGLILTMLVGSLFNSWLMDFTSGYFFVILTACFFGAFSFHPLSKSNAI